MDPDVRSAYEYLVPADRQLVDVLIVTLAAKEKRAMDLARHIRDGLPPAEPPEDA